jgi:hypothetical protein
MFVCVSMLQFLSMQVTEVRRREPHRRSMVGTLQPRALRWIKPSCADAHRVGRLSAADGFRECLGRAGAAAVASLLLAGCANLLPRAHSDDHSPFETFEAARSALGKVVPYRTTLAELNALGFDVESSANVRRIPYPQLVAVLMPNPNLPLDQIETGLRDCLAARQACRAYEFRMGRLQRERQLPLLPDLLNFRRVTHITGWRFEGLLVVRDDVVVFHSHGGEPRIDRTERRVNPLGPFQAGSDIPGAELQIDRAAGAALVR